MGKTTDFIQRAYGTSVATVENVVVLNAALPIQVLQNNPNRLMWTCFNLGANLGYVGFTSAVGALNGIQLAAAGGMVGLTAKDDGELPARELWGIGAGATTLYIISTEALI